MSLKVAIAGGGIGGLAAALTLSHADHKVEVFEKAKAFTEIGAGIQLGPNVTRLLNDWGLLNAARQSAFAPESLQVRSATTGSVLGELQLGEDIAARYGAPYLTMHRAGLHAVLLQAVQQANVVLHLDGAVQGFEQTGGGLFVHSVVQGAFERQGVDTLIAADGLWSHTRQQLLGDGPPRRTGHLAYRALIKQADLPERLRSQNVNVWLGPSMHAVQYPVKHPLEGGDWLNIVVFVHGDVPDDFQNWNHSANASVLTTALKGSCSVLTELVQAVADWRLWVMHDRPPMQGAHQHAQGRVALLGDAAHPMRPYLAQGAGMAIEDAAELGSIVRGVTSSAVPEALQQFAAKRWQRNAHVQARALRNGQIFHATGLVRVCRDVAMRLMGEKLLDMPWLYGFGK